MRAKSDDMKTQFIVILPTRKKEEGDSNEIHTHRRRPFGGKAGRRKRIHERPSERDMEQPLRN